MTIAIAVNALNAITASSTRDTLHCSCLVPNVCASVKAVMACIWDNHSVACTLVTNATAFRGRHIVLPKVLS